MATTTENVVEIITIGREILDGRVIDTNAVAIAENLKPIGLVPRFGQRVDDQIDRIGEAFMIASNRARIVLVTGGLGPTSDDLTAQAFAKFRGEPLVLHTQALEHITKIFERLGRPMNDAQRKQAFLPQSCFMLENPEGTAPGFALSEGGAHWFFMPGVPREMKRMLGEQIIPRLVAAGASAKTRSMTWATQFTSEGTLQEQLTPVEKKLPAGFEITYRTRFPENHVGLYGTSASSADESSFETIAQEITAILGEDAFTTARDLEPLKSLEEIVVERMRDEGYALTTVESCTGGLVASRITNVAGASKVFWGAHVVYDNSAKELLGVPTETLASHGAVSSETARALADLGLTRMKQRSAVNMRQGLGICISTTGIAGPGGGTEKKPVGLCYIGLAVEGRETQVHEIRGRIHYDRSSMKTFFAQKALDLVRRALLTMA